MSDANAQRLTIVKRNAATYIGNPKAKAIGIAGSVARGQADAYSDTDVEIITVRLGELGVFEKRQ